MKKRNPIVLQNLGILTKGMKVDPFMLMDEAEKLYISVKAIGPNETKVIFQDKEVKVCELPIIPLAIIIHVMKLKERWDENGDRLEQHYGLQMNTGTILADLKYFKNRHGGLDIISVKDFIDAVVETYYAH